MSDGRSMYNQLRLQKQLCDAVLRVDETELHVHKVILCDCSSFFSSLFTEWSTSDHRLFNIPHVSPGVMELLIEFAYTGCVAVTPENVEELFAAADRFDVPGVLEACSELMEQHLDPLNCIGVWRLADTYYYPDLKQKAFLFTLAHFEEVAATSEEFLQLSEQDLAKLIESDSLAVRREETVFEAVMRWITSAPDERRGCLPQLLSKVCGPAGALVRLALMSPEYRQIKKSIAMVGMSKQCHAILLRAWHNKRTRRSRECCNCIHFDPLARPRLPTQILLAMGGRTRDGPTNSIEAYDVCAGRWVDLCQYGEEVRANHGTAFLSGSVYCIGGTKGVVQLSSVHKFDLGTHTWHEVAPMHSSRSGVSVAVMDVYIYAIGGYNGMYLKTAERYKPQTNQWTMIASMHDRRSEASCTTLSGKIYICGGFNGNELLSTAECYSPDTNQWTRLASMDSRRRGVGVIAYSNLIFAVGGFDGTTRLRTAEVYDPETNTWKYVSSMLRPHSNFGIAVVDGCLFVVGGFNRTGRTAEVESFDAEANRWTQVRSIKTSRSHLSCCLVYGLNNMADYAVRRSPPETSMEQEGEAES